MICKHCGELIKHHNAEYTNGWTHEGGHLWCRRTMADAVADIKEGSMNPNPLSPDCRDDNHRKCDGRAWDDDTDALASCGCTCHFEPTH